MLQSAMVERLTRALGKSVESATPRDIYDALSLAVREELTLRWLATQRRQAEARVKRVCYLSLEYLPGDSLINALNSLGGEFVEEARTTLARMNCDLDEIATEQGDPGLGNGGFGRLAACFMDSLATLEYAAVGYGIRYDYGIFTQCIDGDGAQREVASSWLRLRNPWETPRANARYTVRFGGRSVGAADAGPGEPHRWVDTHDIYAIGFDQLIPGNRCATVNHLRLWSGRGITPFYVDAFNDGDYAAAVREQIEAKNLSRVLYPDDTTPQGKELRLKQQYFFVSASLQDMLADAFGRGTAARIAAGFVRDSIERHASGDRDPELMRLLVDERSLGWSAAGRSRTAVFSYTNHTLMPEALETWPVAMFERLLPRHLEIIYAINGDFLHAVEARLSAAISSGGAACRSSPRRRAARAHGAPRRHRQPPGRTASRACIRS